MTWTFDCRLIIASEIANHDGISLACHVLTRFQLDPYAMPQRRQCMTGEPPFFKASYGFKERPMHVRFVGQFQVKMNRGQGQGADYRYLTSVLTSALY